MNGYLYDTSMSTHIDGDEQSTSFSTKTPDNVFAPSKARDHDVVSPTPEIPAATREETASGEQNVAHAKRSDVSLNTNDSTSSQDELTFSVNNDLDYENSEISCRPGTVFADESFINSSSICGCSSLGKTLDVDSSNVIESPKISLPSGGNENHNLVRSINQRDQQPVSDRASEALRKCPTHVEAERINTTTGQPSYSFDHDETPSSALDTKIGANSIVPEAYAWCCQKESDNSCELKLKAKHNDNENEKRITFDCLCDGVCLEDCSTKPLKCNKNVPELYTETQNRVKRRACSSIRRLQEKFQGDLSQTVHGDQNMAIKKNVFTKSPKPTSSSALYHMRRQRSRSIASRYGKRASYITQRPYRQWLGVSTNIFPDSKYIVSSKRKTNPSDAATGKNDPVCDKEAIDDRSTSQNELDESEGRKGAQIATSESSKQRHGRPAKTRAENRLETSPLLDKEKNEKEIGIISVGPQTKMPLPGDKCTQREVFRSESRNGENFTVSIVSPKRRCNCFSKEHRERCLEVFPLLNKQDCNRVREETSVIPQTRYSCVIEKHQNGVINETPPDQLQPEEKCSLQSFDDSEQNLSMSSPFHDVTMSLVEKEQRHWMEGAAFLKCESPEPFHILFDGSSCSDMEIQCAVQSKRNENSVKKNGQIVENGLLCLDATSPTRGSEEVDLWTETKNHCGKHPFQFSGPCTPETFNESLTSGLSNKISLSAKPKKKRKRRRKRRRSSNSLQHSNLDQENSSPPLAAVCESTEKNPGLSHRIASVTPDPKDSFRQDGGLAGNVISVARYEFIETPPDLPPALITDDTRCNQNAVPFDGTNGINPLREELKQYLDLGLHPTRGKHIQLSTLQRFMRRSQKSEKTKKREYYNVQAIKNFQGKLPGQLSFRKGQIIKQLDTGLLPKNGMSYGYYRAGRLKRKKAGLYPCTHVTCQVEESD